MRMASVISIPMVVRTVTLLQVCLAYAPASQINPHLITTRAKWYWLRSMQHGEAFCNMTGLGMASTIFSTYLIEIRPRFTN